MDLGCKLSWSCSRREMWFLWIYGCIVFGAVFVCCRWWMLPFGAICDERQEISTSSSYLLCWGTIQCFVDVIFKKQLFFCGGGWLRHRPAIQNLCFLVWYGIYGTSWYLSTLVGASPHCPLLARAYLLHTYKLAREVGVLKQQQQQQQQQQMNSSAVPHHHIKEYYSPHFPQLGFTL